MKRLVLLGEGPGEEVALPLLVRKILSHKRATEQLYVDRDILRVGNVSGLIRKDKARNKVDSSEWLRYVKLAARRPNLGGILAIFDGDAPHFPAGSSSAFCAATAARSMAAAAVEAGAGKIFSLAVVFACVEYESWLIAGGESIAGKSFSDGRPALPKNVRFPADAPESHGKRWLERNFTGYRPTRDQGPLTELLDLDLVRNKNLRSFARLENAIGQLLESVKTGSFVATPG